MDFLIIGSARGGTSLLTTCLDTHPEVEVAFEQCTGAFSAYSQTQPTIHRLQDKDRVKLVSECSKLFFATCDRYAKQFEKPLFGNKILTENIYVLQDALNNFQRDPMIHIQAFFEQIPENLKIIFIVRDGRNLIDSKIRRTGQLPSLAFFYYKYAMCMVRHFRENYKPLFFLRFEDLIADPENTLRQLATFLDISFDSAMLAPDGKKVGALYRKSYFDKSRLNIAEIPHPYVELMMEDLEFCGYPVLHN